MPQRYEQVLGFLPEHLRSALPVLEEGERALAEEIRLRAGYPPGITVAGGERPGAGPPIESRDLEQLLQRVTCWSVHTVLEQLRCGFVTLQGGHRMGVSGTAVMEQGQVRTIRNITSLNLRIARQIKGCASDIALQLKRKGELENTLILAPPGGGKTTLLRDLIRIFSEGGVRVGVADERGELGAVWQGRAQMELGRCSDVICGCPKAQAAMMLLRGMNPQVIAMDEITAAEDVSVMEQAVGCGVTILATAHAHDRADLLRRPLYRKLMETGVFRRLVILSGKGEERKAQILEENPC